MKSQLAEEYKNAIEIKDTDIEELTQTVTALHDRIRHHVEPAGMLKEIRDLRNCLLKKDDEMRESHEAHQQELNSLKVQLQRESDDILRQKNCDIEELQIDKQSLLALLDE